MKWRWSTYPFVRVVFFLILGILSSVYTNVGIHYIIGSFVFFSTTYIGLILTLKKSQLRKWSYLPALFFFLSIFFLGYLLTHFRTSLPENHITHITKPVSYYEAVITSSIQQKKRSQKTTAIIQRAKVDGKWHTTQGQVVLYFLGEKHTGLSYGDVLLIKGKPQRISPPSNPHEFDYQRYLQQQGVYHQQFLRTTEYQYIRHTTPNILQGLALKIREACVAKLKHHIPLEQSYTIAIALVLGIKEELNKEVQKAYATAGAMHVLAVSGLHVGILLGVISFCFRGLKRVKGGKWLFLLFTLLLLWVYAFITGLSPSVLRATTMFSFIQIALTLSRNTNVYNTLALSAFILLCWQPYLLLQVGFQLSYVAVWGIVYLHPKISTCIDTPRNWLLKSFWEMSSVSIAAQLTTFPLSLWYFHQFPTYFLLSNLFVIVGAWLVVNMGLLLLVVSCFSDSIAHLLGELLSLVLQVMTEFIFWVESLPMALISNIYLPIWDILLIYVGIMLIVQMYVTHKQQYIIYLLVVVSFITIEQVIDIYKSFYKKSMVIYDVGKENLLSFSTQHKAVLIGNTKSLNNIEKLNFHVLPDLKARGISDVQKINYDSITVDVGFPLKNNNGQVWAAWEGKSVLLLIEPPHIQYLKTDRLVLANNAVVNLNTINKIHYSDLIIATSNNYKNHEKLLRQAKISDVQCYSIQNNGAYVNNIE